MATRAGRHRRSFCALCLAWGLLATSLLQAAVSEGARLYAEAMAHYRAGELEDALDAVDAAMAADGDTPGLWPLRGWILIRLARPSEAEDAFGRALEKEPGNPDALTGRGYAALHRGDGELALESFRAALAASPAQGDAARGEAMALHRLGRHEEAAERLAGLLEANPDDAELADLDGRIRRSLARPDVERRPRPPVDAPGAVRLIARAGDRYLEVPGPDGTFHPLFVKGVNLGVALPGRFPTQFPEDPEIYHGWLDRIAAMNANAVRLYTLLPPAFYQALDAHNREHPADRIWLLQGVWVELPQDHDFEDPSFKAAFRRDIERVIDAYHGNLDLPARPGHASGRYRVDVSDQVLALILGREWEPFSVVAHNELHPGDRGYEGRFVRMASGSAMEAWLAWVCDTGVAHETEWYGVQRPVAFSNWPTLDPLYHPTETSRQEENALRRQLGEDVRERDVPQYDDDDVSVDAERMVPSEANHAGLFASYHVYPYHPDFMLLEPGYRAARDSEGPSPYMGYLRELAAHHRGQPLLISELGVPTSRGVAHVHPLGWNHGGHSAAEQGRIDRRLMLAVHESGCAGGILFAWLDEWFKRTWMVADLEVPPERDPLWHNLLDPEESFGLLSAVATGGPRLDGRADEWDGLEGALSREWEGEDGCGARGAIRRAAAATDAAYVHLLVETAGADCDGDGAVDWDELELVVGIDTHGDDAGERRLAPEDPRELPTGVEFRVRIAGPGASAVEVVPSYDVGSNLPEGPFVSRPSASGEFVAMKRESNRRRIGRDGTEYPAVFVDHSPLRFVAGDATSLDDAASGVAGTLGIVELRLPWNLLNVTDPSSHRILDQAGRHLPPFDTSTTDRFLFHLSTRTAGGAELDARTLGPFRWQGWEEPRFRLELKASYGILKETFAGLSPLAGGAR